MKGQIKQLGRVEARWKAMALSLTVADIPEDLVTHILGFAPSLVPSWSSCYTAASVSMLKTNTNKVLSHCRLGFAMT